MITKGGETPPEPPDLNPSQNVNHNENEQVQRPGININANSIDSPQINRPRYERMYNKKDSIYLLTVEADNKNIGKFSQIKIAKEIFELKLKDIKKIKVLGKSKIGVEFSSYETANSFLENEILKNKGLKVTIPYNYTSCKGVVRAIDPDLDPEILKRDITINSFESQKINNVIRLNRRVQKRNPNNTNLTQEKALQHEYIPTYSILVTFDGTNLPRYISLYNLELPVIPYIPRVTQCYNCFLYGHTKKLCKGKQRCFQCAEQINLEEEANHDNCTTKCYHCKSENHKSNDKKCPEFARQENIKKTMIFENISYYEAATLCPKTNQNMNQNPQNKFILDPRDFPAPKSKPTTGDNIIQINQRRATTQKYSNQNNKRSYQHVLQNPPKKRITQQGYDKEAHNQQLYFPNTRPEKFIVNQQKQEKTMWNNDQPSTSSHIFQNIDEHNKQYKQTKKPESAVQIIETLNANESLQLATKLSQHAQIILYDHLSQILYDKNMQIDEDDYNS